MSTVKQILQQASQSREPKSPQIYRRGRVTNSAAYYRGVKPDPEAGRVNATAAKFLSDIAKPLGQIAGKRQKEFAEAERNAGIASFTRATPEQRAKMRNAIKNGIISESESPYFREGVSIAYTKNLLGKYNQDLFQRYEQWEGKNKEDSGNFDQFLDEFDSEYAPYFETIHQDILTEHFIPGQMGVRRQLQQRHTEHLNKNYRDKADIQYQGAFHQLIQDFLPEAYSEQLKNNDTLRNMVSIQETDHINTLTTEEGLMGALKEGNISKKHRDLLSQGKYGQAILKEYDERFGAKSVGPTSQTPSMDWLYRERTLEVKKEVSPLTTWNSVSKTYSMTKEHVVDLARQIKVLEYKGKPQPEGKQDLSYIEPKNWTPEQRKEFESLIDDIKGMTAEGKVILKNKS